MNPCLAPEALARAVSGAGLPITDRAHLRGCARCQATVHAHEAVRGLALRLRYAPPSPERQRRMRQALLERSARALNASERRLARWLTFGGLAALAAAALLLVSTRGLETTRSPRAAPATIVPSPGAVFTSPAGPPHEVVRLSHGTLHVSVPPAQTVRLVTGAGQVEVRGSVVTATAVDDRLAAVLVERGQALVRAPSGASAVALDAGGAWIAATPAPGAPAAPKPAVAPGHVAKPEVTRAAAPAPRSAAGRPRRRPALATRAAASADGTVEAAFGDGLALLRGGDPAGAAAAFGRAERLARDATLAEEAAYWRAVALTRAGETAGGREALAAFVARFPSSTRTGEAAVMLGWLLLDRGETSAAARRFEAALADPSARVRKSARAGLAALARP